MDDINKMREQLRNTAVFTPDSIKKLGGKTFIEDKKEYSKFIDTVNKNKELEQKKQEDELFNQFKILDAGFTPKQMVAICTVLRPDLSKYIPKK